MDSQTCNIRDFKVAVTQLAFIFQVSRPVLEIRMRDLAIVRYEKNLGYNGYTLFGDHRPPKLMGQVLKQWMNKFEYPV